MLAKLADKYAIIRSWQGRSNSHATGLQHVMSGVFPATGRQIYPNMGCVIAALQGIKRTGVATHVGLPVDARYTFSPANLGPAFSSFDIIGDPSSPDFKIERLQLPRDRFDTRRLSISYASNQMN